MSTRFESLGCADPQGVYGVMVDLSRLIGKTIEGVVDVGVREHRKADSTYEVQLTLSDGSELLIVNPKAMILKKPERCPCCGKVLETP